MRSYKELGDRGNAYRFVTERQLRKLFHQVLLKHDSCDGCYPIKLQATKGAKVASEKDMKTEKYSP